MRRTSLSDAECPIARSLDTVGDWWSLLIVRDAMFGRRRFNEFQKSLGMARNILSARLRDLVTAGILETTAAADGSPYKDYVLTRKGWDLFPVLVALRQWGEAHQFGGDPCPSELLDRANGDPVRKLELRAADGRLLDAADTMISDRK
ncbi:MAG: helix-turn-helix domain-containing protein [Ferrovibrio sp.]